MLIPYQLDPATVQMLLEGLDHLPHGRVRRTYDAIMAQAVAVQDEHNARASQEPQLITPAPAPRRCKKVKGK
jgi:hypothetical protein